MEMSMGGMEGKGLDQRKRVARMRADTALAAEERIATPATAILLAKEILETPKEILMRKRGEYLTRLGKQAHSLEESIGKQPEDKRLLGIKAELDSARAKILAEGPMSRPNQQEEEEGELEAA